MKRYDVRDGTATPPMARPAGMSRRTRAGLTSHDDRPGQNGPTGDGGSRHGGHGGHNGHPGNPGNAGHGGHQAGHLAGRSVSGGGASHEDATMRVAQPDVKRRAAHSPDDRPGFILSSPLGDVVLRGDDRHLSGLWFAGQKHFPTHLAVLASDRDGTALPDAVREGHAQIVAYFAGKLQAFSVPLSLSGTPFQQQVWAMLLNIPFGKQVSYGSLANAAGLPPGGSRAIGNAVGRNPVSVIVPCHRVIGASGTLTGYAGGLERKQHLLTLEGGVSGNRGLFD
jgi:methylated-DNA-[protein]-cysteine S-methyltransferase